MARPIKETSILCGEDAKRFEERMKNVQKETPEQRKIRLEHYHMRARNICIDIDYIQVS